MKKIYSVLILNILLNIQSVYGQCSLYPVSLSSRIAGSSVVLEGTVVSRQSFWNASGNYIYTSNLVEVSKVMKGSLLSNKVEIITEGGEVGLKKQVVQPSLQLKAGDEGVFILNPFESVSPQFGYTTFRAFADEQGFINYDPTSSSAREPFKTYNSINNDLYPELETIFGIELPDYVNAGSNKGYNPASVASVSGISPLTITAGTSSIITISGSGFGASQSTSFVEFYNADDGGATFIKPDPSQYVSWSNTQIQVMVPTRAGTVAGTAGTGPVRVTVASSATLSAQTLTVDYGELNVYYNGTSSIYNTRHVDLNGSAGITWQMYTSFDANTAAKTAFLNSLQTWRCNTYINWGLGSTVSTNTIASDGINVVRFDVGTELPVGVLGRCTSYFSGCIVGPNVFWFVDELDICFDDPATSAITWQFGPSLATGIQYDFESVSLHELGHGHQLSHVINSNDVMHYALSNSQNKRNLITQNINAGNHVMSRNTSAGVCSMGAMTALTASNCSIAAPTASFNIGTSLCSGQTLTLTDLSTGLPTAWSWTINGGSPGTSTLQNTTATFSTAGTYSISLIASNGFGSSSVLTKTITIVSQPTLSVVSASICSGASTLITASGATNYTWNPGGLVGAAQNLNPVSSTIYTITGSNGSCSATATSTLAVTTTPTVSVANASLCSGSSTLITASGAPNYIWNPGALTGASQNLSPLSTTAYTVTGSNGSCTGTAVSFSITVTATPTLNVPSGTLCSGNSTLLTVSGAASYIWMPGSLSGASQNLNPVSTTVYTITGSVGSCSSNITTTVSVSPSPTLSVPNAFICSGSSSLVTASGATSYTWNPGGLTGAAQNLNPSSTTTYTIIASVGSCTQSITTTVSVTTTPTISVANASICSGVSTLISASGATSYTWNPGGLSGASQNLSPSSTTIYTITGANGICTNSSTSTVSVTTTPTISVASTSICTGTSTLITASGANSYTWNPGNLAGASQSFNPSSTIIYTITGSIGSCTSTGNSTIHVTTMPTVAVTGGSICAGNSIGVLASGATAYTWNPGALTGASQNLSPTSTTIYTVTGRNGICATTKTTVVTVFALPSLISIATPTSICSGATATIVAGGAMTYTWTNNISTFSTTGAVVAVNPSISALYTAAGFDGTCVATTTVFLQVNPNPTVNIVPSSTICNGSSTVLTASGADTYTWNPGNLSGASATLNPVTTTVYTISGTYSATGCNSTFKTSTITVLPKPVVFCVASPTVICPGGTTALSGAGGISYSWSPGSLSGTTVSVSPSVQTTYTMTGFDGSCSNTATVTVAMNPVPTLSVGSSFSICSGSLLNTSAYGAVSYTWNPGNLTTQNVTLTPLASTVYTVAGTNAFGCTSTANMSVTVATQPTLNVTVSSTTVCPGKTVTLSVTGATNYTWSPGSSFTSSVVVTPSTTSNYLVWGSIGYCTAAVSTTLYTYTTPTLSVSATPAFTLCSGASTSLSASGAVSYTWTPSNVTSSLITVTPPVSTSYTVMGTSVNGCTAAAIPVVSVAPSPTITISSSQSVVCFGNTTTLTGTGASSYTWLPGGATGSTTVVSPTAATLYQAIGVTGQCSSTNTISILVNPVSTVVVSASTNSICSGLNAVLSASGAASYSWIPGNLSGSTVTVSPNSTTIYTVTGYHANGCPTSSTQTLTVSPSPTLNPVASSSMICSGNSVTLSASGANSYTWTTLGVNGPSVVASPTLPTFYTVLGTLGVCTSSSSLIVLVNPVPTIFVNVNPNTPRCSGSSFTLVAGGGANTYFWMPGNLSGQSVLVSPTVNTTYTVTGTFTNTGCSTDRTIAVTVIPNPSVSVSFNPLVVCSGSTATLTANGANNYTWNPGNLIGAMINITPTTNITYSVIGTVSNCPGSTVIAIPVTPNPTITLSASNSLICLGEEVTISASGASSYTYLPVNSSGAAITVSPLNNTTYTVNGEDQGCIGSNTLNISVSVCDQIQDIIPDKLFRIFPNPAQHEATLDFGGVFTGDITIFNAIGQLVAFQQVSNVTKLDFNLNAYAEGVYLIKINSGQTTIGLLKLIKQ